jgi:hypothetical protein
MQQNLFYTLATTLCNRGEDLELIAQELALALVKIIKEEKGKDCEFYIELDRLLKLN